MYIFRSGWFGDCASEEFTRLCGVRLFWGTFTIWFPLKTRLVYQRNWCKIFPMHALVFRYIDSDEQRRWGCSEQLLFRSTAFSWGRMLNDSFRFQLHAMLMSLLLLIVLFMMCTYFAFRMILLKACHSDATSAQAPWARHSDPWAASQCSEKGEIPSTSGGSE